LAYTNQTKGARSSKSFVCNRNRTLL